MSMFSIDSRDDHRPRTSGRAAWRSTWSGMLRSTALAAAIALASMTLAPSSAMADDKSDKAKAGSKEVKTDQVELIFHSGRVIKGTLISETATEIKVKVTVAGMTAETTYPKADILTINRNLPVTDPKPADEAKKDGAKADEKKDAPAAVDTSGKPKVYLLNLKGRFGRDVNATPVQEILEDIRAEQPDYLVIYFDHTVQPGPDGELREFMPNTESMQNIGIAERLGLILYDEIYLNDKWTKKPQLVGWVHRALGGATYLPLLCPRIYYTSDALHSGLGYLDRLFGHADPVVREKWRGAWMGGAEGMAIRGGYDPRIVRAMLRIDMVLSYKIEGGKAVLFERMPAGPDEFLLTDDGLGENQDGMQDMIRFKGNDSLLLTADLARRLDISKGTADNFDQLLSELGITGEYVKVGEKADKIIKDWGKAVTDAEVDIRKLFRDWERAQEVKPPGDYKARSEARGRMISVLRQMKSILKRYGESIDPREIEGAPDDIISWVDRTIEAIQNAQRLDRK